MREIKFRGLDTETKVWRYGHYFESNEGIRICQNIVENRDTRYYCELFSIHQFAGFKDKNGKEIYEGDICIKPYFSDRTTRGVIEFLNGAFVFVSKEDPSIQVVGWSLIKENEIEVVGNIYENPLLFENENMVI